VSDIHVTTFLACVFMLGLCSCAKTDAAGEKTAHASDAPSIVSVVKTARADLASDLVLTAEFEPFQQVDVMAKVAGYIRSIKVDIGDRVHEGQLLATLEIPEMADEAIKASASSDQAVSEVSTASDQLHQA